MRLLIAILAAASLVLVLVPAAAAGPPTAITIVDVFEDEDPCTGEMHEVTLSATFWAHEHGGRTVARGERTLSTSGGYVGRRTSAYVENGRVEIFRFADVLADESGNRIRASGLFVLDLASGTARVDVFELTCLGG